MEGAARALAGSTLVTAASMLGDAAPDVTFTDQGGREIRLRDLPERPLVLMFLRWLG